MPQREEKSNTGFDCLKVTEFKDTHYLTAAVGSMAELGSNFSEGILNWLLIKTPRTVHEPKMTKSFNVDLKRCND